MLLQGFALGKDVEYILHNDIDDILHRFHTVS